MKEDYLWDKTGNDPEIEKLEDALRVFRYKESAPPALPAKVVAFPVQRRRRVIRFAIATAACLLFGVISLGVWFQILRNNMDPNPGLAAIDKSQSDVTSSDNTSFSEIVPAQNPDVHPVENIEISSQSASRRFVKIRKSAPAIARQKEIKAHGSRQTKSVVRLTEEEKFAYNQLMIALSITSSKLKIVKDKVEGFDEKPPVLENAR